MSENFKLSVKFNTANTCQQFMSWITRINPAWLLVLPLLLLLPTLRSFPYPSLDSVYSDLTISHYPNAVFLRESIATWGEIPLWSRTIMAGYPFAANPLSGLWYPPGWLAIILPLPLGFNLLIGLHLVWGGLGVYKLMKAEGLGNAGALLAGLSFGLLPKLFAHYGAGHLTLLYAVPWTPWLLLSQHQQSRSRRFSVLPGLLLGMVLLADVRWGAFALLTWWGYAAVHRRVGWWELIKRLSLQTALALLLAAPLLLPLIEFSALSTRAELSAADVLAHSLPFVNLIGLLFPNPEMDHEWVFYLGGIVSLSALSGLVLSTAHKRKYFWGGLCLVSILVALGSQVPGLNIVSRLPLISLMRVPARALFLAGIGMASLAGYGADAILGNWSPGRERLLRLLFFGFSISSLLLIAGFLVLFKEIPRGLLWGTIMVIIGAAWIGIGLRSRPPGKFWLAGLLLIAVFDLAVVDLNSFVGRNAEQVLSERAAVAEYIVGQGGDMRTYSPSYSLPQQTAVLYGLQMTDGVDPLQIAAYSRYMDAASGVPRAGYSVTIPYFESGEPRTDNKSYLPDAEMLGVLNVGYVVSDFTLQVEGLELINEIDGVLIYSNEMKRYQAWVQPNGTTTNAEILPAEVLRRSPNRLEIKASGPGTLVVSEIAYPGWSVEIDGIQGGMRDQQEGLMGVDLEPGPHQVEFTFRPTSVYFGLLLFLTGAVISVWQFRIKFSQDKP